MHGIGVMAELGCLAELVDWDEGIVKDNAAVVSVLCRDWCEKRSN